MEDLMNCDPMFFLLPLMKFKVFRVTQNETPKIVKMSASTNKLSQKFAEHIYPDVTA